MEPAGEARPKAVAQAASQPWAPPSLPPRPACSPCMRATDTSRTARARREPRHTLRIGSAGCSATATTDAICTFRGVWGGYRWLGGGRAEWREGDGRRASSGSRLASVAVRLLSGVPAERRAVVRGEGAGRRCGARVRARAAAHQYRYEQPAQRALVRHGRDQVNSTSSRSSRGWLMGLRAAASSRSNPSRKAHAFFTEKQRHVWRACLEVHRVLGLSRLRPTAPRLRLHRRRHR